MKFARIALAAVIGAAVAAPVAAEPSVTEFFEIHKEGRVIVMADAKLAKDYFQTGEVVFRDTRIGAGPYGQTLVFGLTKKETKDLGNSVVVGIWEGKVAPSKSFYGEMHKDGKIYVFPSWADMNQFRKTDEVTIRFTDIGAGPNGETVVYALNKAIAKTGPVAQKARFNELHGKK